MKNNKCVMCGEGDYVDIPIENPTDRYNSGIAAAFVGGIAWRATECNLCGNVQMFRYRRTGEQMLR